MERSTITLADIKKLRLERHWSQEQLAEMSGLSTRTIQRIESGQNADFETLKSLASVFEINLSSLNKKEEEEQLRVEEKRNEDIKGLYKFIALAVFSLIFTFFISYNESNWIIFGMTFLSWLVIIGVYSVNTFDLFKTK
ncbi:MAG: transcriptional regulator with XRE-family HTH domain [Candidatus Azotimanducaceae bacterium]|jgi:transcriptional regulator with XRE-family HTH domain|tara:strand:+ start:112 stop:528 length:417 start_codon:yes stop_codon:yes gene_type:complete